MTGNRPHNGPGALRGGGEHLRLYYNRLEAERKLKKPEKSWKIKKLSQSTIPWDKGTQRVEKMTRGSKRVPRSPSLPGAASVSF